MYTMVFSAQDFRNVYEKFYNQFRLYLWPFNTVEDLANLETTIYTAFFDPAKLKRELERLRIPIKEAVEDNNDKELDKLYKKLVEMANDIEPNLIFHSLNRVEEVNPDEDKQIKFEKDNSESEFKDEGTEL